MSVNDEALIQKLQNEYQGGTLSREFIELVRKLQGKQYFTEEVEKSPKKSVFSTLIEILAFKDYSEEEVKEYFSSVPLENKFRAMYLGGIKDGKFDKAPGYGDALSAIIAAPRDPSPGFQILSELRVASKLIPLDKSPGFSLRGNVDGKSVDTDVFTYSGPIVYDGNGQVAVQTVIDDAYQVKSIVDSSSLYNRVNKTDQLNKVDAKTKNYSIEIRTGGIAEIKATGNYDEIKKQITLRESQGSAIEIYDWNGNEIILN
ncbi:hypothetical protein [Deinococcus sp.]|uniref:hypothetical protein n=1 Tax=Deinococcus sp. TaxID=47478 RepID=UPI0025FFA521|nr:hypothetical protein [Deinococcus sp.]